MRTAPVIAEAIDFEGPIDEMMRGGDLKKSQLQDWFGFAKLSFLQELFARATLKQPCLRVIP